MNENEKLNHINNLDSLYEYLMRIKEVPYEHKEDCKQYLIITSLSLFKNWDSTKGLLTTYLWKPLCTTITKYKKSLFRDKELDIMMSNSFKGVHHEDSYFYLQLEEFFDNLTKEQQIILLNRLSDNPKTLDVLANQLNLKQSQLRRLINNYKAEKKIFFS